MANWYWKCQSNRFIHCIASLLQLHVFALHNVDFSFGFRIVIFQLCDSLQQPHRYVCRQLCFIGCRILCGTIGSWLCGLLGSFIIIVVVENSEIIPEINGESSNGRKLNSATKLNYSHYLIRRSHLFRFGRFICVLCRCWSRHWSSLHRRSSCSGQRGCSRSNDRRNTIRWFLRENRWHKWITRCGFTRKMQRTHVRSVRCNRMSIVLFDCFHPFGTQFLVLWESVQREVSKRRNELQIEFDRNKPIRHTFGILGWSIGETNNPGRNTERRAVLGNTLALRCSSNHRPAEMSCDESVSNTLPFPASARN